MGYMKKTCFLLTFFTLLPLFASAAFFDRDLFFGMRGEPDVTRLQEFLKGEGVYSGPITGNFFNLTREGVSSFQRREGIEPSLGYFGPKSRVRANTLLGVKPVLPSAPVVKEDPVAALMAQIQALEAQIKALQAQSTVVTAPTPPPAPLAPVPPPTPPPPTELRVSGGPTVNSFPASVVNPIKLGDFTITNGTADKILFAQIILSVSDDMNSPINRGRDVIFVLRKGPTTADEIITSTKLRLNSNSPQPGSPHLYQIGLSYPFEFQPGEARQLGLWLDSFEYVISGTLMVEFNNFLATTPISPKGTFNFTLTK